jgi:hypothetical protein
MHADGNPVNVYYWAADCSIAPRSGRRAGFPNWLDTNGSSDRPQGSTFMSFSRRMFEFAFGCHHSQLSRVFTLDDRTYRVCFDCGQQVEYSWELMRSVASDVADSDDARRHRSRRAEVAMI